MEKSTHGLNRELRLRDLVFMQITLIFSLGWVGFAAKQGSTQLVLWLVEALAYYLPLPAVVMELSRLTPQEAGVYGWANPGLSPFAGYMAGWGVTTSAVLVFPAAGAATADGFVCAAGPRGESITT